MEGAGFIIHLYKFLAFFSEDVERIYLFPRLTQRASGWGPGGQGWALPPPPRAVLPALGRTNAALSSVPAAARGGEGPRGEGCGLVCSATQHTWVIAPLFLPACKIHPDGGWTTDQVFISGAEPKKWVCAELLNGNVFLSGFLGSPKREKKKIEEANKHSNVSFWVKSKHFV